MLQNIGYILYKEEVLQIIAALKGAPQYGTDV
jgi:hypothetical protein